MTANPVFVLGLGAQKAGTSWIADYLRRHPAGRFGPIKEYHVWDTVHLPELAFLKDRRDPGPFNQPRRFLRHLLTHRKFPRDEALRRDLRRSPAAYTTHFRKLVGQGTGPRITGDITPEYAGLSAATLRDIRDLLTDAGFDVRPLFVMRDPVERCISAVAMYRGRASARPIFGVSDTEPLAVSLEHHAFSEAAALRGRYDRTLAAMDDAFGRSAGYIGFYEELFSQPEIDRVCTRLGISQMHAHFDHRVNAGPSRDHDAVPKSLRVRIARYYARVYEEVAARFGEQRVTKIWPSFGFL